MTSQHQNHLKNILRKLSRNCLKYNIYILDRSTAYYIYYKYRSFIGILKFRLHKKNWKLVTRYLLYIWCLPIFGNLNVLQWHFSSTVFAYKIISNNLGGNFEALFFQFKYFFSRSMHFLNFSSTSQIKQKNSQINTLKSKFDNKIQFVLKKIVTELHSSDLRNFK